MRSFDDCIWREPVVQKMGGTPLTAMLVLFYTRRHKQLRVLSPRPGVCVALSEAKGLLEPRGPLLREILRCAQNDNHSVNRDALLFVTLCI
jgi:hypothetical protein